MNITNNIINNKFGLSYDKHLKLIDEFNTYLPTYIKYDKEIIAIKFFTDKYHPISRPIMIWQSELKIFHQFNNYLQNNKTKILKYNNISNSFIDDYMLIYDNSQFIDDKKNILMFNTAVNISEAILYYNTIKSNFGTVNYYVENIYSINEGDIQTYKKYFDILKKNYDGEHIYINLEFNYHDAAKQYQNKNIDLIIFDIRRFLDKSGTFYDKPFLELNFSILVIVLRILQKGGAFIMYNSIYPPSYLELVLHILAKYFKSISMYKTNVRNRDYYICNNFIGIENDDLVLFNKQLLELNISYTKHDIIVSHVHNRYKYLEKKAKNNVKIYKKYIDSIDNLTIDLLIKYYENISNNDYYNIYSLCKKYKLSMDDVFLNKFDIIIDSMMNLYVYNPIQIYGFSKNLDINPNDIIKLNKNKINLDKMKSIFSYMNINKIGIDTRNTNKWNQITFDMNISNSIAKYFKQKNNAIVTRGFIKMYEMLHTFNLIKEQKEYVTMHICEAPGHFINATSYFIKTKFPNMNHTWYGNSLNPFNNVNKLKYGNILSDIYGFIKNNPNKWIWGDDNTGDITNGKNIKFFKDNYSNKIDLFTSDCGLETKERIDFFTQENTLSKTNFSQIFISLLVLKIGGSAIFKFFFPFSKQLTVSMIYLLTLFFEQVYICKPNTSSSTNNEIYFVSINKKFDINQKSFNILIDFLNNFNNESNLFDDIDDDFIKQLEKITLDLVDNNINQLNTIYNLYDDYNYYQKIKKTKLNDLHNNFVQKWMQLNDLHNIDKSKLF